MTMIPRSMRQPFFPIALATTLAGCSGWEGPSHWLQEDYVAGLPASACAPTRRAPQGDYPAHRDFNATAAGWSGSVRAQEASCIVHTPPIRFSKATWVECKVRGPAVITHAPPISGGDVFAAGAGVFDLRATRRGLSCRPIGS